MDFYSYLLYSSKDPSHIGSDDKINQQNNSQGLVTDASPILGPAIGSTKPKGSDNILGSSVPFNSIGPTNDSAMTKSTQPDAHTHQGVDLHSPHSGDSHHTPKLVDCQNDDPGNC